VLQPVRELYGCEDINMKLNKTSRQTRAEQRKDAESQSEHLVLRWTWTGKGREASSECLCLSGI